MKKQNKTYLIIAVIAIVLLIGGYFMFVKAPKTENLNPENQLQLSSGGLIKQEAKPLSASTYKCDASWNCEETGVTKNALAIVSRGEVEEPGINAFSLSMVATTSGTTFDSITMQLPTASDPYKTTFSDNGGSTGQASDLFYNSFKNNQASPLAYNNVAPGSSVSWDTKYATGQTTASDCTTIGQKGSAGGCDTIEVCAQVGANKRCLFDVADFTTTSASKCGGNTCTFQGSVKGVYTLSGSPREKSAYNILVMVIKPDYLASYLVSLSSSGKTYFAPAVKFRTSSITYPSTSAIAFNPDGLTRCDESTALNRYGRYQSNCFVKTTDSSTCPVKTGYTLQIDKNGGIPGVVSGWSAQPGACLYTKDSDTTQIYLVWFGTANSNHPCGNVAPVDNGWAGLIYDSDDADKVNVEATPTLIDSGREVQC